MITRKSYLTKVVIAFGISLLATLFLMMPVISNGTPLQDEPYRVETFEIDQPGNLNVKTSGGHITVKGSSSNTVRVEMFVQKNGRNLLPEDTNLENWQVSIGRDGNSVKAIAQRSGNKNWNLFGNSMSISFVVYTPRQMSSDLKTSGGHIEMEGISGEQQLSTSGGHLELASLEGTIKAKTSGGHIKIMDVRGDLNARTSGGHIDARNSNGKLTLKTSGGHIELADVSGTVEASTSGGSISAQLNSIGQFVNLSTSGGNVNIEVPSDTGFDLNLRGSYVSTKLENFSGRIERDEVKGKLNGGGPRLSAQTSGGTVSVTFHKNGTF